MLHTREITNEWVVPHCRYFLLKYGSHINVEAVTSVGSVKYVYKYCQKGRDRAMVTLVARNPTRPGPEPEPSPYPEQPDEIKKYEDTRVIGSSMAAWFLLGNTHGGRAPGVVSLDVHAEDESYAMYAAGTEQDIANGPVPVSSLVAWIRYLHEQMRLGLTGVVGGRRAGTFDAECFEFKYSQFPFGYIYTKTTADTEGHWRKRSGTPSRNDRTVGLLRDVDVSKDIYYLRMLLVNLRGRDLCICACSQSLSSGASTVPPCSHTHLCGPCGGNISCTWTALLCVPLPNGVSDARRLFNPPTPPLIRPNSGPDVLRSLDAHSCLHG